MERHAALGLVCSALEPTAFSALPASVLRLNTNSVVHFAFSLSRQASPDESAALGAANDDVRAPAPVTGGARPVALGE